MALAIEKQDRETAHREGLFLFQISIDGRHLNQGFGKSESSGACSREMADKLRALIRDWTDDSVNVPEAGRGDNNRSLISAS